MKPTVLALSLALVATSFGQVATGRIPQINSGTKPIAIDYHFVESVQRSQSEIDRIVKQKQDQYNSMVSSGRMSRQEADEALAQLKRMDRMRITKGKLTFHFQQGDMLVTRRNATGIGKPTAWTLVSGNSSVLYGWGGGDYLTLSDKVEPYSTATDIPILPVNLQSFRIIVDLEQQEGDVVGRMLSSSTASDTYFPTKFTFADGHLSRADQGRLERWTYADFTKGEVPLPLAITLERDFDSAGQAQVVKRYSGKAVTSTMPKLDDLIQGESMEVLDWRSDPVHTFTYIKGKGSLIAQSASGKPRLTPRLGASRTSPMSIPLNLILIGAGLTVLFAIAAVKIIRKRLGPA